MRRFAYLSLATIKPLFSISWASKLVLPPGAAHRSSTTSPGLGSRANPDITEEQLEVLKKNKDFKALLKDNRFIIVDKEADVEEEVEEKEEGTEKSLEDMSVAELKTKAKEAGHSGVSSLNKGELLELLKGDAE